MTQYAIWASYSGAARIWLAIGLLAAACCVVVAGIRLPLPIRLTRPGPRGLAATIAAWAASILALLVCVGIYSQILAHDIRASGASHATLRAPILPVTLTADAVLFVIIMARSFPAPETRLASAVVGAMAAPMIFELPFDPLVIARFRGVPLDEPRVDVILVYAPLVLTEITTLLLLRLSPMVRLTRATFFCFALMLAVWAVWAMFGFGYPSAPLPTALNMASKVLAIGTGLTLFMARQPAPEQSPERDSQQPEPVNPALLTKTAEHPQPGPQAESRIPGAS